MNKTKFTASRIHQIVKGFAWEKATPNKLLTTFEEIRENGTLSVLLYGRQIDDLDAQIARDCEYTINQTVNLRFAKALLPRDLYDFLWREVFMSEYMDTERIKIISTKIPDDYNGSETHKELLQNEFLINQRLKYIYEYLSISALECLGIEFVLNEENDITILSCLGKLEYHQIETIRSMNIFPSLLKSNNVADRMRVVANKYDEQKIALLWEDFILNTPIASLTTLWKIKIEILLYLQDNNILSYLLEDTESIKRFIILVEYWEDKLRLLSKEFILETEIKILKYLWNDEITSEFISTLWIQNIINREYSMNQLKIIWDQDIQLINFLKNTGVLKQWIKSLRLETIIKVLKEYGYSEINENLLVVWWDIRMLHLISKSQLTSDVQVQWYKKTENATQSSRIRLILEKFPLDLINAIGIDDILTINLANLWEIPKNLTAHQLRMLPIEIHEEWRKLSEHYRNLWKFSPEQLSIIFWSWKNIYNFAENFIGWEELSVKLIKSKTEIGNFPESLINLFDESTATSREGLEVIYPWITEYIESLEPNI